MRPWGCQFQTWLSDKRTDAEEVDTFLKRKQANLTADQKLKKVSDRTRSDPTSRYQLEGSGFTKTHSKRRPRAATEADFAWRRLDGTAWRRSGLQHRDFRSQPGSVPPQRSRHASANFPLQVAACFPCSTLVSKVVRSFHFHSGQPKHRTSDF